MNKYKYKATEKKVNRFVFNSSLVTSRNIIFLS